MWTLTVVLLSSGFWLPASSMWLLPWFVPIGSIALFGAMVATVIDMKAASTTNFNLLLAVMWGAIAIFYDSSFVGFLSVGALMAAVGFSAAVIPMGYVFGFKDDSSVQRGIGAGVFAITAYILMRSTGFAHAYVDVFQSGALWLGGCVSGIGFLIVSSTYYDNKNTVFATFASIAFMVVGILAGSLLGIREVTTVYTAFLILLAASKIVEVDTKSFIGLGVKLMLAGGVVGGAWYWFETHHEIAVKYLAVG
jgi:hypothetical protein